MSNETFTENYKDFIIKTLNDVDQKNIELQQMILRVDELKDDIEYFDNLVYMTGLLMSQLKFLVRVLSHAYQLTNDLYFEEIKLQTQKTLEDVENGIRRYKKSPK